MRFSDIEFLTSRFTDEQLLHLQLRVARRADELARAAFESGGAGADRAVWRRAEGELLRVLEAVHFGASANREIRAPVSASAGWMAGE